MDKLKQDLANLQKFKESHQNCKQHSDEGHNDDSIIKEGKGAGCVCSSAGIDHASPSQSCSNPCAKDFSYNPNLNVILPEEAPRVEIPHAESKVEVPIPIELCLSKIWKKHVNKARKLLEELEKSDRFSIDKMSMVSIDNLPLHISIFNLLKQCFESRTHISSNLSPFVDLVRDLHIENYIVNKYILMKDNIEILNTPFWYYIG